MLVDHSDYKSHALPEEEEEEEEEAIFGEKEKRALVVKRYRRCVSETATMRGQGSSRARPLPPSALTSTLAAPQRPSQWRTKTTRHGRGQWMQRGDNAG